MAVALSQPSAEWPALAVLHCKRGAARIADGALATHLATRSGRSRAGAGIVKTHAFANFRETIGAVDALAWIANREDHHSDLRVSCNGCTVACSTQDAGGVTHNDVVCAATTDRLLG